MSKRVIDLTPAGELVGTELLYITLGGNDYKVSIDELKDFLQSTAPEPVPVPQIELSGDVSGSSTFDEASGSLNIETKITDIDFGEFPEI